MPRKPHNPRLTCSRSDDALVIQLENGHTWTVTQKGSFLFLAALKDADGNPLEEEVYAVRINRQDGRVVVESYPDVTELAKERRSRRNSSETN